jgi:putative two-component system response regulator
MRILIVDDNEIALDVLTHALTQFGHEVEAAREGAEALEALSEDSCRLVISDWEMPGMDGLELCRRVRREEFSGYIYFILLTARSGTDNIVEGLSAGADDFLTKPFDPGELRVRIRAAERVLSLETRDVAIFAMAKLAESRDPETGAHLERVRSYSRLIARRLTGLERFRTQVDAEFIRLIYLTSPLHDIGKVGIPDSVLLKPGRLSDREFEIMKTHTTIGADTLDAAAQQFPGVRFLEMAREIALTHHERYDGSGYPSGLSGDEIPLSGRIVALADVYDALTSKRVYKQAFSHDSSIPRSSMPSRTARRVYGGPSPARANGPGDRWCSREWAHEVDTGGGR